VVDDDSDSDDETAKIAVDEHNAAKMIKIMEYSISKSRFVKMGECSLRPIRTDR
jgi:hypothetical protein